jgi:hypothetical protein
MRIRLALAAALAALSLAACDSGTDADVVVGTWAVSDVSFGSVAVVSETQTALDLLQPGTGTLTATGALSRSFRYVEQRRSARGAARPTAVLSDVATGLDGGRALLLVLPDFVQLSVVDGAGVPLGTYVSNSAVSATITPEGVAIGEARLVDGGTGAVVVVSGALTYARRTYTAGEEVPFERYPSDSRPSRDLRATFGADGAFEGTSLGFEEPTTGTWALTPPGRLAVRIDDDVQSSYSYEYSFPTGGDALVLAEQIATFQSREAYEDLGAFRPGTLVEVRAYRTQTYGRAAE